MALFKWVAKVEGDDLLASMARRVETLGLEIDKEISTSAQLYASDPTQSKVRHESRVNVLATWSNKAIGEVQLEVRSAEPMLRKGTRCEETAEALQKINPPYRPSEMHTQTMA